MLLFNVKQKGEFKMLVEELIKKLEKYPAGTKVEVGIYDTDRRIYDDNLVKGVRKIKDVCGTYIRLEA